jgi:hypothetical protein
MSGNRRGHLRNARQDNGALVVASLLTLMERAAVLANPRRETLKPFETAAAMAARRKLLIARRDVAGVFYVFYLSRRVALSRLLQK